MSANDVRLEREFFDLGDRHRAMLYFFMQEALESPFRETSQIYYPSLAKLFEAISKELSCDNDFDVLYENLRWLTIFKYLEVSEDFDWIVEGTGADVDIRVAETPLIVKITDKAKRLEDVFLNSFARRLAANILVDNVFRIRPLLESDREGLYAAASDPLIWEQNPATNRHERPVFDEYFDALLNAGGAVVFDYENRIIGCSRYYPHPGSHEFSIGFTFIERELWGGGVNLALKSLMLHLLFETQNQVWFHVDPDNFRSGESVSKLGALPVDSGCFDLLGNGQMMFYVSYALSKEDWLAGKRPEKA